MLFRSVQFSQRVGMHSVYTRVVFSGLKYTETRLKSQIESTATVMLDSSAFPTHGCCKPAETRSSRNTKAIIIGCRQACFSPLWCQKVLFPYCSNVKVIFLLDAVFSSHIQVVPLLVAHVCTFEVCDAWAMWGTVRKIWPSSELSAVRRSNQCNQQYR